MDVTQNETGTTFAELGPSSRVAEAYKKLLRYIHVHKLTPGDHLPPQEELRNELGYSHHTLSKAMGMLTDAGVVSRKPKVGTIVQNPEAVLKGVWTVGLITQPQEVLEVPFFAFLSNLLQSQLIRMGCRVHMYPNIDGSGSDRLEHFPGLPEEVAAERLDGVMATVQLQRNATRSITDNDIVLVHVGPGEKSENAVCIDQRAMVKKAADLFISGGCRQLAVVSNFGEGSGEIGFWRGFQEALDESPEHQSDGESLHEGNGPESGTEVARKILERPASERPDGLIVVDDRIAMGLTVELSKTEDYRPRIAVQANREVPLAFPIPVTRFYVNIEEMARLGAQKMVRQLRDPSEPDGVTWLEPQILTGENDDSQRNGFSIKTKSWDSP
ncbi:MAG: GntR family transcriptional regulator [Candidatus Brocadiia bacterium]